MAKMLKVTLVKSTIGAVPKNKKTAEAMRTGDSLCHIPTISATKKVIPEQLSHNISVGYSLCDGRYSVVAECNNLTDAKLYDNYRLQKPGRSFNVKFRYYLSK